MKKLLLALAALLVLNSCNTVYFEQPQPKCWPGLPSFPKQLQGTYPMFGEEEGLVITKKTIQIQNERTFTLGEDLYLKRYQGFWVLSLKNPEGKGWEIYAIDKNKGIKTLNMRKNELSKLDELFRKPIVEYDQDGDPLPLDVSRRQFKKILKSHFKGIDTQ